jgi:hypothetical protein
VYRLDHWNWRLPPRRIEENRTRAVALLGDRGRRAGKKGKYRKGRECRAPFHENQSVFSNRFKYNRTTEPFLSRLYRFGVLGSVTLLAHSASGAAIALGDNAGGTRLCCAICGGAWGGAAAEPRRTIQVWPKDDPGRGTGLPQEARSRLW